MVADVAVSYTQVVLRIADPRTAPQTTYDFIIAILTPFPDITRHIMQAVTIGLETTYWCSLFVPFIFATSFLIGGVL